MKIIADYSNQVIITRHLKRYNHSPESIKTRKAAFNYFFGSSKKKYFDFDGHISEIDKDNLIDYFDYLNDKEDIALTTKKLKWTLLCSLLEFCMEYYDDFLLKIPKKTIKWKDYHLIPLSNKDITLELKEIQIILNFLKVNHFTYYLIFRIFAETGMRKGEHINIEYQKVNTQKRYIDTYGKKGEKIYYTSKELAHYLEFYINNRKIKNVQSKALFISRFSQKFSKRYFNLYLSSVLKKVGIDKQITCKTFRSSVNTLRYNMGCPTEDRKILLNHKIQDVNFEHYVKLNYEDYLQKFDTWNPFKNIQL